MKQTFLLILAALLISCNTQESKGIELLVYKGSILNDNHQEYNIATRLYAQISKNGDCILNVADYGKGNRFISFKIKTEILDSIFSIVYKADSDMTVYKDDYSFLYDGPSIRIVGKNKNEKTIILRFIKSDRSNLKCLNLYKYIDSISRKPENNSDIDTTKILQAKEKLIKEICKKDVASLPPLLKSIRFIAPVIKKHK